MDYMNNLVRNYRSASADYQTPVRRLSDKKRELTSKGLSAEFCNHDMSVYGRIILSDRSELVVYCGKNDKGAYLMDASDEQFVGCRLYAETETSELTTESLLTAARNVDIDMQLRDMREEWERKF